MYKYTINKYFEIILKLIIFVNYELYINFHGCAIAMTLFGIFLIKFRIFN